MKENLKFASFLIVFFLIGGAIIVFSIFEFYYVSGESMSPTYDDGQYLFVRAGDDLRYDRRDTIIYQEGEKLLSTKRIIGLPGENIQIENGKIYVDNIIFAESYLSPGQKTCVPIDCTSNMPKSFTVPEGEYFVLGDNRSVSRDSRDCYEGILCSQNGFRSVPQEVIIGKITTTLPSWLSSLLISQEG